MEILKTPTVQWGAAAAPQPGRKTPTLQWGAAEAPLPGQNESGDRFLVEPFNNGVLIAVVDALAHGDTLIVATDGIDEQFADQLPQDLTPQPLAEHIFAHYAKSTDDALVLVARYGVAADERGP